MAALTADNAASMVRDAGSVVRPVPAATAVYAGSFVMEKLSGELVPLAYAAAGLFAGIAAGGHSTTGVQLTSARVQLVRKGMFKTYITGIAITDFGKPVWCSTDNPADCTLAYSAGAHLVGHVKDLEYDALGAVSGYCYVEFDTEKVAGLVGLPRGRAFEGYAHIPGGIEFWTDFLNCPSVGAMIAKGYGSGTMQWLVTRVDGGSDDAQVIKLTDSEPDGTLEVTTNNAAADIESLQPLGAHFTPGATAVCVFAARFKVSDITKGDLVIGMCARGGAKYTASGGGFFIRVPHNGHVYCVSELGSTENAVDSAVLMVNDTYVSVLIVYELGASVKFYVNGTLITSATCTDITKIVTGVDLAPTIEIGATDTSQPKLSVDYLLARQTPRV